MLTMNGKASHREIHEQIQLLGHALRDLMPDSDLVKELRIRTRRDGKTDITVRRETRITLNEPWVCE